MVAFSASETFLTSANATGKHDETLVLPHDPVTFFFLVKQLSSSLASTTFFIREGIWNGIATLKNILYHNLTSCV